MKDTKANNTGRHSGQGGGDGDDPFANLIDLIWDALLVLGISAAAGVALAAALWLARLRWDWSILGIVPAGVAVAFDPVVAVGISAASVTGGVLGWAWQRRQIDRGGTEAQEARERIGPLRAIASARRRRRASATPLKGDRLAIGMSSNGRVRTIPFGIYQGVRGFLPGAPNSGKTVTMTSIALAYIRAGLPVIAIDPKRDGALREALATAARRAGKRFLEWTPQGPAVYNPLGRGEPSEIVDKALAGEQWTEPHYLRQAQRYLGHALRTMQAAGRWSPSLSSLSATLEFERLESLAGQVGRNAGDSTVAYLESLAPKAKADLGGVRDRLAVLAESQLGRWLEPNGASGAQEIDLADAMKRGDVVYFNLDADRYQLASTMLGAAVIVDLVSLTAELQGGDLRGLVLIDEFSAIESESIARLLSRSRSAGLSVVLATQAMADLDQARADDSDHGLRNQVLSQVDFVIAHRQSEPEAAEFLASYAGTRPEWTITERVENVAASPGINRLMSGLGRGAELSSGTPTFSSA